jgi:hypothetical protein
MLTYTAIFQNSSGRLSRYTATASNDRPKAWKQISTMKENEASVAENEDECLILLVPGNHPVVRYEDIKETQEGIDLFSNY